MTTILLLLLSLALVEQAFPSFCGSNGVPFSLEVLSSGAPVLGCAQPSCVAIPDQYQDDSSFATDSEGHPDGFLRQNDKLQKRFRYKSTTHLVANCSKGFTELSCSRRDQWVGGIEYIDHPRQPLILQCCSFPGLQFSQDVGLSNIGVGEAITGGEVIRDGRQISFDVIANVRKIVNSETHKISYDVTIRRMNCLPDPPEPDVIVDDGTAEEMARILTNSQDKNEEDLLSAKQGHQGWKRFDSLRKSPNSNENDRRTSAEPDIATEKLEPLQKLKWTNGANPGEDANQFARKLWKKIEIRKQNVPSLDMQISKHLASSHNGRNETSAESSSSSISNISPGSGLSQESQRSAAFAAFSNNWNANARNLMPFQFSGAPHSLSSNNQQGCFMCGPSGHQPNFLPQPSSGSQCNGNCPQLSADTTNRQLAANHRSIQGSPLDLQSLSQLGSKTGQSLPMHTMATIPPQTVFPYQILRNPIPAQTFHQSFSAHGCPNCFQQAPCSQGCDSQHLPPSANSFAQGAPNFFVLPNQNLGSNFSPNLQPQEPPLAFGANSFQPSNTPESAAGNFYMNQHFTPLFGTLPPFSLPTLPPMSILTLPTLPPPAFGPLLTHPLNLTEHAVSFPGSSHPTEPPSAAGTANSPQRPNGLPHLPILEDMMRMLGFQIATPVSPSLLPSPAENNV